MKFNFPINNFSSGEWSPRMMGRTDTEQYPRACSELTNMIVQMTGGASYRGGFQHIPLLSDDAYDDAFTALEDIEWQEQFKILSYTPAPLDWHGLLMIFKNKWYFRNQSFATQPVSYSGQMLSQLAAWRPSGTMFTVLGDLIVLVNISGLFKPKVFYYDLGSFSYVLKDIDTEYITAQPWKTIPWSEIRALDSNVTLNPSATTGSMTVTASASYFKSGMIGSYLRFANGTAASGVARITAVASGTSATALVVQTLPNASFAYGSTTNNASFWQESAWSDTNGWPRTVTAHQGRLVFGGSKSKPDTLWGSRISSYFDFQEVPEPNTTGPLGFASAAYAADNSRPFTLTPNSPEAANIVALSSSKTLTIHTDKAEIIAYGSNGALGPVNVVFESSTSFGASPVQPVRINNYLTFVQKTARKIRDVVFNFNEDQYKSTDLSFTADHYFLREDLAWGGFESIQEIIKTEANSSVLWVRTRTGKLFALTLDRDYQVNAWSRIPIGQAPEHIDDDEDKSFAAVLSMCSHPIDYESKHETVYALVIRKPDGVFRVSLEALNLPLEIPNPGNTIFEEFPPLGGGVAVGRYLDCGTHAEKDGVNPLKWNSDPLGEGSFYANCTVSVIADGNYIGEVEVGGDGTFLLANEHDKAYIGFKYQGRLITTPIEQGGQTGVPMGRSKRVNELVIRFFNTAGCQYGKADALFEIPFRDVTMLNTPMEFFTGDKIVDFPAGYEEQCQVIIEQNNPYPMHVVAVIPQGTTYD